LAYEHGFASASLFIQVGEAQIEDAVETCQIFRRSIAELSHNETGPSTVMVIIQEIAGLIGPAGTAATVNVIGP
jgi:hypothetical protein